MAASSSTRQFSAAELKDLKTKDDLHLVIHGKVYAVAPFVDEHPGGDEVLFGEAGRDATEAFEDVGHSDEAREILKKYLVGVCDDLAKGPASASAAASKGANASTDAASSFIYLLPLAALVAYIAYHFATRAS